MFQSVKTIFREFYFAFFEVASASVLTIYGTAAAKQHRYNLNSHTHAAAVPYIVSTEALATSKQGKIKLPEDDLDRLKHVGFVGSILTN